MEAEALPGTIHRLDDVEKPYQGDGYLFLFTDGAGGFIQNHRNDGRGESFFFAGRGTTLTEDQRRELRKSREAHKRVREAEAEIAVGEVLSIWQYARPADPNHPYLIRKKVPLLAGQLRELAYVPDIVGRRAKKLLSHLQPPILICPITDMDGRPMTAEYIDATGAKRYHPAGKRDGGIMIIPGGDWFSGPVYLCEGGSTGATIAEATGRPVVVAFDAGNLPKVADAIRRKYPALVLVIAADDDIKLEQAKKPNKGMIKAHEAAETGRALAVMVPDFTSLADRGHWSDFNDMAALCGLQAVRDRLDISSAPSRECPDWLKGDALPEFRVLGFNEADIALAFARLRAGDLRFVKQWEAWMQWDRGAWRRERTEFAYDQLGGLCWEIIHRGQTANAAGNGSFLRKAATRTGAEKIARADRRIAATAEQWDLHPWFLNTPGGVIDLRTGELHGHRPDYYLTMQTNVTPDPDAHPERWFRFLNEITRGQLELQSYLQRLMGYALTGDTREQMLAFFYGEGANGKGTFIKMTTEIMGDYAKGTGIELLMESRGDRHPTELANLKGARLVTTQEVDQGKTWSESRVKSLTGQDTVTARFMRGDFFDFEPTHKIIVTANNKPRFNIVDHAIRRRLQLVPFLAKFEGLTKDTSLMQTLRGEQSGILQWMIEGVRAWLEIGLAPPLIVTEATSDYLDGEDLEAHWLEECCVRDPQAETPLLVLFQSWIGFAEQRHGKQRKDRDLADRLEREGFRKTKERPVKFIGVRLKSPTEISGLGGVVVPLRRGGV